MTVFKTSRELPTTPEKIFAAFSQPERLAKWWGPAGFTNTFDACEFKNGGKWSFTMHGPDGKSYPNQSLFVEIESPKKVVIQHISEPKFYLTILMTPSQIGTLVSWSQDFEDSELAAKIEHIVVPSNEENLDRLSDEVVGAN